MNKQINLTTIVLFLSTFTWFGLLGCMIQEPKITEGQTTSLSQTAVRIEFKDYPLNGNADSVWAVQPLVELYDKNGDLVTTGADAWAPITVSLYSGSGELTGQATVYAIRGRAQFVGLKINASGNKVLKATKNDLSSYGGAEQLDVVGETFAISSASANKLNFSGSTSVQPGVCNAYQLLVQDSGGNTVTLSSDQGIVFTNSGNAAIYSDSTCSTSITSANILSGTSSLSVYLKTDGHESLKLFATTFTGALNSASLEIKSVILPITDFFISPTFSTKCFLYSNGAASCTDANFVSFGSKKIQKMSLGYDFRCALLDDGSVWCWGDGSSGKLGNGASVSSATPVQVSNLGGAATDIISGNTHTCALVNISGSGTVKCWGYNISRQLGDNTTTTRNSATQVALGLGGSQSVVSISKSIGTTEKNFAVLSDGTAKVWGGGANPANLAGVSTATSLTAYHSGTSYLYCIVNIDKTSSCWGSSNSYGQLGSGNLTTYTTPTSVIGLSDVKTIASNFYNSCAIKDTGELYCWGLRDNSDYMVNEYGYSSSTAKSKAITTPELITWLPKFSILKSNYYLDPNTSKTSNYYCGVTTDTNTFLCLKWNIGSNLPEIVSENKSKTYQVLVAESSSKKILTGSCQKVTLKIYNNGVASGLGYNLPIDLAITNGFGNFYLDSGCIQSVSQVTLLSGQTFIDVYLKTNNTSGDPKYSYISPSTNDPSTASIGLVIQTTGLPYDLGDTSEVDGDSGVCYLYTLQLVDSMGNYTKGTTTSTTVDFSIADSAAVKIYSDSNCTSEITSINIPAGNYSGIFYGKILAGCGGSTVTATVPSLTTSTPKTFGFYENCGCD